MIRVIFIVLIFSVISCRTGKNRFILEPEVSFSENEMNLIVAVEFLKQKLKKCNGSCDFSLESNFIYFDTCNMVFLEHLGIKKTLLNKRIDVPTGIYSIEDFGTIKVKHHTENEIADFIFSPLFYDKKANVCYGQLKYKDGRREYFCIDIINAKFYLKYNSYYYGQNCNNDYDSY